MNEVINAIYTRRSVRKFADREIPLEQLKVIADCARYAPSARNQQKWRFTVVRDRAVIERLAAVVGKELDRDGYDFYKPERSSSLQAKKTTNSAPRTTPAQCRTSSSPLIRSASARSG